MASEKKILLVHGAGPKPASAELLRLWRRALEIGLTRDAQQALTKLADTQIELFYFADKFSELHDEGFDANLDVSQREQVLEKLGELARARDFRRRNYEDLPGKTTLKEFKMDVGASLGLGKRLLGRAVPELDAYWADRGGVATQLRQAFIDWIEDDLRQGVDLLLVTHCVGSVIAYDGLWSIKASHSRISTWVTLGSPLGSAAVKRQLLGATERGNARFPQNILSWQNISAEDDFMCHDKTVADDFRAMMDARLISDISDHTIYNLAVRYGRSNPHHSAGYLVHPRMTKILADWLG